jgi:hypothetical protein
MTMTMIYYRLIKYPGKWLIVLFNLSVLLLLTTFLVAGAIDLLYFRAKAGTNSILLEWATASEFDISGFYIVRSLNQETGFSRISPFIFAKAVDSLVGAEYEYEDKTVNKGVIYYYKLEVLPTNTSQSSEFHGPISASIGGITATPTSSQTPTKTATSTPKINPTRRPTATRNPTVTLSPTTQQGQNLDPLPTQTQNPENPYPLAPTEELLLETIEITSTSVITQATATLIPFPDIAIEFPATQTKSNPKVFLVVTDEPDVNPIRPGNFWFIGIVLMIWFGLGIFVVRFLIHRS